MQSPSFAIALLVAGTVATGLCARNFLRQRKSGYMWLTVSFLTLTAAAAASLIVEHLLCRTVDPTSRTIAKLVVIAIAVPLYLIGSSTIRTGK